MEQLIGSTKISIVRASIEDLPELGRLFEAYRTFYLKEPDLEKATAFLRQRIENHESVVFLALSATGQGLGFTQLYPLFSSLRMRKIWLLNDLYVDDRQRGKGIGIQLLEKAKELAKQTNAAGLILETEKGNLVGNTLYPKMGFKLDIEHNHYRWDAPTSF